MNLRTVETRPEKRSGSFQGGAPTEKVTRNKFHKNILTYRSDVFRVSIFQKSDNIEAISECDWLDNPLYDGVTNWPYYQKLKHHKT